MARLRSARMSAIRNRIETSGSVNQYYKSECNLESMLLVWAPKIVLQHGVIPGSSQTKARESALQGGLRSTSWDLRTMESDNGTLCGAGRVVKANFDLCCERYGIDCARRSS